MSADTITIRVSFGGNTKHITIRKYAQVFELFRMIRQEMFGGRNADFFVIYHGEPLEEHRQGNIDDIGIRHLEAICLCVRSLGGGGSQSTPFTVERSFTPWVRPIVKPALPSRSTEKCCIFKDDIPGDVCYKMPCGCVYSTMAIQAYSDTVVDTEKNFSFSCQVCFTSWSYDAVRHVLIESMKDEELIGFNEKLNDNYTSKQLTMRRCPTCKNLITRDFSKYASNPYCIKCVICTAGTGSAVAFCWCCLKPWSSSSGSTCGNVGCLGKDPRIQFLETCGTKKLVE